MNWFEGQVYLLNIFRVAVIVGHETETGINVQLTE
jgi:hypothetical protein